MQSTPTICLCMIVKNEAQVISRCLASVRPIITHWLIVDTGSTDGTQDLIRREMQGLPGELHERPWKNFAHNRTEALALARPLADYSLIIDADDALEIPNGFVLGSLGADGYLMEIRDAPLVYPRIQLVNNRLRWLYRGVLHEFAATDGPHQCEHLPIVMRRLHDGARRKDPECFRRDSELLEQALKDEKDGFLRSRYMFYLAQSYRDAGKAAQALETYIKRAAMGGWQEEVYVSLYQSARLKEQLDYPQDEIISSYDEAKRANPARAEAAHWASRFCRTHGLYERGYEIARESLGKTLPPDTLFAEPWVYETGLLDEFSVNAYWCGHYAACLDASLQLLSRHSLGEDDRQRVTRNAALAWEQLSKALDKT